MMNAQTNGYARAAARRGSAPVFAALAARRATFRLIAGEAMQLGRSGGELSVVDGRVWLTRDRDLGDHFVQAGQKLQLARRENAVIESADTGRPVVVRWVPATEGVLTVLAEPLRAFAYLALRAGQALTAFANTAKAVANDSQGCVGSPDALRLPAR